MKPLSLLLLMLAAASCGSSPNGDFSTAPGREYTDRIAAGFTKLGASDERSRCYSERLSDNDLATAADAAKIVEESTDRDDMRRRVLSADGATTRAFIGAKFGCSFYD